MGIKMNVIFSMYNCILKSILKNKPTSRNKHKMVNNRTLLLLSLPTACNHDWDKFPFNEIKIKKFLMEKFDSLF